MEEKQLYLIDATAFCYRAYYALPGFATSFGQPTNAVFGFVNILNKILKDKKPQFLAACFDVSRDTFRQKKFAEYKIQRPPMPDGLSSQLPLIKEIIKAMGITLYEMAGYEADDVIATLAKKAKQKGLKVAIVSSDKDILQLVDSDTVVFSPYKDGGVNYDSDKVKERFGVSPGQISDIIALMGDDADNIPGVKGIGEKTAIDLIKTFGSLEKLLSQTDKIKSPKIKQSIKDSLRQINLSKELAILRQDLDLAFDLDKLKIGKTDTEELTRLYRRLEFKKFLKNLIPNDEQQEPAKILKLTQDKILKLLKQDSEVFLYEEEGVLTFAVQDKIFQPKGPLKQLKSVLEDPGIKKAGHDLKKIKLSLAKQEIILEGLFFDTMVAAYLLNPSKPAYALGEVAWDYLESTSAGIGAIVKLRLKLEKELKEKKLFSLFQDIEMPLVGVLSRMELNGVKLDLRLLSSLAKELEKMLIKLIEEIYQLCDAQFNLNSTKQLRQVLFEKLKLPVVKRTKTGASTDEEVLRNLAKKHRVPALLLDYRQLTKIKSTYVDTLPDLVDKQSGKIHTSFNQAGTETGRLSSSNPNLQNLPIRTEIGRKIRQAVIASDKDSRLLSCDYSQIELRVLAHLSGDPNLISAFKQNHDIHKITASLIHGLEEKEVNDEMREMAKRVNFGIVYGLTSYGLSRDLGISVNEAENFIDAYFLRYPKVQGYIQQQIKSAEKDGFVTTILGRRRYMPEINNKNQAIRQFAQRQAINTPIQGSAADLIKLAMIKIDEEIRQKKLKARMILQIHDELLFDVPRQDLTGFVKLAKEHMEQVMKLEVPIKVELKQGINWLEMEAIK